MQHELIWLNYLPCEFAFRVSIYAKCQSLGNFIVEIF